MGKQKWSSTRTKNPSKDTTHYFVSELSQQSFYVRLRESNYHKLHILPDYQNFTQSLNRNKETTLELYLYAYTAQISKNKKGEKMFKVKDQESLQKIKKIKIKHYPISLLSEQSFMWLLKALTLIQRPLKLDTDDSPKTSWTKTYDTSVLSLLVFPWSHMNLLQPKYYSEKIKFLPADHVTPYTWMIYTLFLPGSVRLSPRPSWNLITLKTAIIMYVPPRIWNSFDEPLSEHPARK